MNLPQALTILGLPEVLRLQLTTALLLLVVSIFAQALVSRAKTIYMADLLGQVVNTIRRSLFARISETRWLALSRMRGSDLNHALIGEVDRLQGAIYQLFMLAQTIILLAGYTIVCLLISPTMTLFAVLVGGIVFAIVAPIRRLATAHGETLTSHRKLQYRIISEFVSGLKVAKSLNAEPRYLDRLSEVLTQVRTDMVRYTRVSHTGFLGFQMASAVSLAIFVYVAIEQLALPLAEIVVLLFLFMRIAPRFTALQQQFQDILANYSAYRAVEELMEACRREAEGSGREGVGTLQEELRFDTVSFHYDAAGAPAVREASFVIPANKITAVFGPSGGGKSTLGDLMLGLMTASSGAVLVDGLRLTEDQLRRWRDGVAYVPQDVFMLHDSIAENLRLGAPAATEAEIWEALERAKAKEFVSALPEGLQTVVGDRGLRLSGGERQRIALARALLRRPRLLILDEATSALDWENQMLVARSIQELRGKTTVVTIAHRASMIAFADWVIAVEDGRVVETGDFAELASRPDSALSRLLQGEQGAR